MKNIIIFFILIFLFTTTGYYGITLYKDRTETEEEVYYPIVTTNDQSGWIENYVYLTGVSFKEESNVLTFKVENRSEEKLTGIENLTFSLSTKGEEEIKKSINTPFDLGPYLDKEIKGKIKLKEGKKYKLKVYVHYGNKEYLIGETHFFVN